MILFSYLLLLLVVVFSVFVAISQNSVHSVLSLIAVFFFSAVFLLLNNLQFFAVILVMVYIGAVIVFFLFVTMILEFKKTTIFGSFAYIKFFIISSFFIFFFYLNGFLHNVDPTLVFFSHTYNSINQTSNFFDLSTVIYNEYSIVFLFSGIILLVAIIGCISLSTKFFINRNTQNISDQQLKSDLIKTF